MRSSCAPLRYPSIFVMPPLGGRGSPAARPRAAGRGLLALLAIVASGLGGCDETSPGGVTSCVPDPCGASAICVPVGDGHRCECEPGLAGDPTIGCVEVEACASRPCGANSDCVDEAARRRCACRTGFGGDPEVGCAEIDACATNACGANATCTDLAAPALGDARTCACTTGFGGDAVAGCTEVDACVANPRTCGRRGTAGAGALDCWGDNAWHQLGLGHTHVPQAVDFAP